MNAWMCDRCDAAEKKPDGRQMSPPGWVSFCEPNSTAKTVLCGPCHDSFLHWRGK